MKKLLITTALIGAALASPSFSQEGSDNGPRHDMMRKHMEEKLKETDTNGDGQISESEFMARAKKRFQKMDADGNGQITREEGRAMHEKMREKWQHRRGGEGRRGPGGRGGSGGPGGDMPPPPPGDDEGM